MHPESMMTYQVNSKVHAVKLYNDDTAQGLTRCGIRVQPWHVPAGGQVTCKKCLELTERRTKDT